MKHSCFDVFSVYDLENDKLYFISSDILNTHKKQFTIRFDDAKGGGNSTINHADDYLAEKWNIGP